MNRLENVPESRTLAPSIGSQIFALCALFNLVITWGWRFLPEEWLSFSKTSLIGYSLITLLRLVLTLLLPTLWLAWRRPAKISRFMGKNPGAGAFILSFFAGIPAILIGIALHNLLLLYRQKLDIPIPLPSFIFTLKDTTLETTWLFILVVVLLPLILEELFFRGALFYTLPSTARSRWRILVSALFFAIYLQNPIDFFPLLLLGLLLGYIRHITNFLFCTVVTRVAMAITFFTFASLFPYTSQLTTLEQNSQRTTLYTSTVVLVMSLCALFPILFQLQKFGREDARFFAKTADKENHISDKEDTSEKGSLVFSLLLYSFGLIMFLANWVLLFDLGKLATG